MPRRITVVGNSGSGKSTLSRAISARLGCDHIELDSIHHLENWTPIERNKMRQIVRDRIQAERWVVDGNYGSFVRDLVFASADTIVWLDLPRRTVMQRITRRTLGRMITRRELWNGNKERFANLFKTEPEENIILWAWTQHHDYHEKYLEAMNEAAPHADWVQLTSPRDVANWLARLTSHSP